jgi:hypothetical protein
LTSALIILELQISSMNISNKPWCQCHWLQDRWYPQGLLLSWLVISGSSLCSTADCHVVLHLCSNWYAGKYWFYFYLISLLLINGLSIQKISFHDTCIFDEPVLLKLQMLLFQAFKNLQKNSDHGQDVVYCGTIIWKM